MIHRDVEIIDLDPQTWRHLGAIFPVGEWGELRLKTPGVITLLHEEGTILTVDAPPNFSVTTIPAQFDDPVELAQSIYAANPGLTRVQIFEKNSLRAFSHQVQQLDWRKLSSGDYYLKAWEIAGSDPRGLCYYPSGLPRIEVLKAAQSLIQHTADGEHLILGVYDNGHPYFSLIVRVNQKQITMVTTFDALVKYGVDPRKIPASSADSQIILPLIEQHFGTVAQALFCEREALMALIEKVGAADSKAE